MLTEKVVGNDHNLNVPIRIKNYFYIMSNQINVSSFLIFAVMLCITGCAQTTKTTDNSSPIYKEQPTNKPADKKTILNITYATSHIFKIEYEDTLRIEAQKSAEEHCGTVGTSNDKWKTISKHGKVAVHKKTACYARICNSIYHCEK